jgi:hypothetical protein
MTLTSTAAFAGPAAAQDEEYTDPFRWSKCNVRVNANLKITAARSMRCRSAKRVMRRHDGSISRRFSTSGFKCKLIKGRRISGVWRCKKGRVKAFRFAFGD